MQGATRSMSSSTFQASAGGSGTSNELSNSMMRSIPAGARRRGPGDLAEHRARGEAGAAGIIEIEQAADQLARRIEPADRLVVGVEHLAVVVDAQAPEREGNAAGHRIALERRGIDRVRPVVLVDRQPDGATAVLDVGIDGTSLRTAALYSAMVF